MASGHRPPPHRSQRPPLRRNPNSTSMAIARRTPPPPRKPAPDWGQSPRQPGFSRCLLDPRPPPRLPPENSRSLERDSALGCRSIPRPREPVALRETGSIRLSGRQIVRVSAASNAIRRPTLTRCTLRQTWCSAARIATAAIRHAGSSSRRRMCCRATRNSGLHRRILLTPMWCSITSPRSSSSS